MKAVDKQSLDSLAYIFTDCLEIPLEAVEWLLMIFIASQFFDDVADKDEISEDFFLEALWNILVEMPKNSFYQKHHASLSVILELAVLKWNASDIMERKNAATAVSFVWRAAYYDIVLYVCRLCHGVRNSMLNADKVLMLYGESLDEYLKEFGNG